MIQLAPRYDDRVRAAILVLDDGHKSAAEICRQVGNVAARLGLTRPSYVHVRRLVQENRAAARAEEERRSAVRGVAADVVTDLVLGRFVDAYEVPARVRAAKEGR
jgi:hypothetical protein